MDLSFKIKHYLAITHPVISLQVIGLLDVFTPDTSFDEFKDV